MPATTDFIDDTGSQADASPTGSLGPIWRRDYLVAAWGGGLGESEMETEAIRSDPELYGRVMERLATTGPTVTSAEVLGVLGPDRS